MKASVAYKTLDNITVVLLAFKNFRQSLQQEFLANHDSIKELSQSKESGQVGGSVHSQTDERSQQAVIATNPNSQNAPLENLDSSNGGLQFTENTEVISLSKTEVEKTLNLPNGDLNFSDTEKIISKSRMPKLRQKKSQQRQSSEQSGLQTEVVVTSRTASNSVSGNKAARRFNMRIGSLSTEPGVQLPYPGPAASGGQAQQQ